MVYGVRSRAHRLLQGAWEDDVSLRTLEGSATPTCGYGALVPPMRALYTEQRWSRQRRVTTTPLDGGEGVALFSGSTLANTLDTARRMSLHPRALP